MLLASTVCLLAGCTDSPTDRELVDVYAANRDILNSVVALCEHNPELMVIEFHLGTVSIRPPELMSKLKVPAQAFLSKITEKNVPQQVDCVRFFAQGIGRLTAVRFTYYPTRFGLRRSAKSLHRELSSPSEWLEGALRSGELRPTGIEHWYVHEAIK